MKKLVLMLAAASMAASVSAQTVAESKAFDNVYVGINGGVATKTTGHKWLSDLDPNAGLRIGRTSLQSLVWQLKVMLTSQTSLGTQQVQQFALQTLVYSVL